MYSFRPLRPRGWLLLAIGVLALFLAFVLGRRDLLTLAVFCFALPAVACGALYLVKPGFTVKRRLSPTLGRVGSPVEATLDVHGRSPGGSRTRLVEELPFSFRDAPSFNHPQPVVPRGLLSRYHYTLHPSHRGVFTIGPLRGLFADPFDVAFVPRLLDGGTRLTIAPAAVELPPISLTDGRGQDGSRSIKELAHASSDDAMTREYRYGDPLRRVHWAVTARQGKLMVRADESVTTPEAALVLDRRAGAFGPVPRSRELFQIAGRSATSLPELRTTPAFEAAVVAAMSVAAHLLEHGYTLRILDHQGQPGFASSASAVVPGCEEFSGSQGVIDIAAALAAQELSEAAPGAAGAGTGEPGEAQGHASSTQETAFADPLAHKLHGGRRRGPLVAVTGLLSAADALLLAGISESTQSAYALLLCQDPDEAAPALAILRRAGWQAAALTPTAHLAHVWTQLDQPWATTGNQR
ncbi:DUF58 domain-containing protein [Arthrobacter sp. LAPM80]|uniref:DUF58 domain-containing protein n=1 Tax=Arthrobacter sp. LAPM80 TaxID=3141788 RepID=UPI00398B28F2